MGARETAQRLGVQDWVGILVGITVAGRKRIYASPEDMVTLIAGPRIEMLRSVMLNHWYHHRGELVVYLRAAGHKVPGLYGPTYEDGQAAAQAGREIGGAYAGADQVGAQVQGELLDEGLGGAIYIAAWVRIVAGH